MAAPLGLVGTLFSGRWEVVGELEARIWLLFFKKDPDCCGRNGSRTWGRRQRGQWERWETVAKVVGSPGVPPGHETIFFSVYPGRFALMLPLSPATQPFIASLVPPTLLSAPSCVAALLGCRSSPVHRSVPQGEGRGRSWLPAECPAVGRQWGHCCGHIACVSGFLPVPACPSLPCPSSSWGSTRHFPAPTGEEATTLYNQQGPSSPTGRAVHLRSRVATLASETEAEGVSRAVGAACSLFPVW